MSAPRGRAAITLGLLAGFTATVAAFGLPSVAKAQPAPAQHQAVSEVAIPGMAGHFSLKSAAGGTDVTESSFPGKWLIIYFGYTQCPDACPTALNAMAASLVELGPLAAKTQPLFVTVDPQRDTPQVLAGYVKAFDPRILGLYGDATQTAAAAKAFHIYYAVRNLGNGEYAIDHSSFIYIVSPGGHLVELLTGNLPAHSIATALSHLIR